MGCLIVFSLHGNIFHRVRMRVNKMSLLSGIRVFDEFTVMAAPFGAGLMADLGQMSGYKNRL
jgi:hypothetical protein